MIKFKIKDLKVGDDVLFQQKGDNAKEIRWIGKVDKVTTNKKGGNVQITYFALFKEEGVKGNHSGSLSFEWNGYDNWTLYKINKEEVEKLNRELLLLNLK